jgi:hypothetical protein
VKTHRHALFYEKSKPYGDRNIERSVMRGPTSAADGAPENTTEEKVESDEPS